jgi:hypothetical protein
MKKVEMKRRQTCSISVGKVPTTKKKRYISQPEILEELLMAHTCL